MKPHFTIGTPDRPYLHRWYLTPWSSDRIRRAVPAWLEKIFRWLPNAYVHKIIRSDDDRALHDHPWLNVSVILAGGYTEVVPWSQAQGPLDDHLARVHRVRRRPGSVVVRRSGHRHRLEVGERPCWTLFITGPKVREWGFYCKRGWVHWKRFVAAHDRGQIGRGCEP